MNYTDDASDSFGRLEEAQRCDDAPPDVHREVDEATAYLELLARESEAIASVTQFPQTFPEYGYSPDTTGCRLLDIPAFVGERALVRNLKRFTTARKLSRLTLFHAELGAGWNGSGTLETALFSPDSYMASWLAAPVKDINDIDPSAALNSDREPAELIVQYPTDDEDTHLEMFLRPSTIAGTKFVPLQRNRILGRTIPYSETVLTDGGHTVKALVRLIFEKRTRFLLRDVLIGFLDPEARHDLRLAIAAAVLSQVALKAARGSVTRVYEQWAQRVIEDEAIEQAAAHNNEDLLQSCSDRMKRMAMLIATRRSSPEQITSRPAVDAINKSLKTRDALLVPVSYTLTASREIIGVVSSTDTNQPRMN